MVSLFVLFSSLISNAGVTGLASNDRILMLEQKIYKLQEELTEQHRSRGEVSL